MTPEAKFDMPESYRSCPDFAAEEDVEEALSRIERRVVALPISSLRAENSPRLAGVDRQHVKVLADSETVLPPILVQRQSMQIIDGIHRVEAMLLRGQETIDAYFFEGSDQLSFLIAVKCNTTHGLPLSYADREAAAKKIFESHAHWSDRAVAVISGISATTAAAIRACSTVQPGQSNMRVGRDGRIRPLNGSLGRKRAQEMLTLHPGIPLRQVAREAGVSLGTAFDVRDRMRKGMDPLRPSQRAAKQDTDHLDGDRPAERRNRPKSEAKLRRRDSGGLDAENDLNIDSIVSKLKQDPTFRYSANGRVLLRWLDMHTSLHGEWNHIVPAVPMHWQTTVAKLARSFAADCLRFAENIEATIADSPQSLASPKTPVTESKHTCPPPGRSQNISMAHPAGP